MEKRRPTIDEYYLKIAEAVALRSTCLKKHYGAIIVNNSEVISTGYNNPPRGEPHCIVCTKTCTTTCEVAYLDCKSVHAEQNTIISASRNEMIGATLYLAGFDLESQTWIAAEPCEICLRLIKNAGIDKVVNASGVIYQRNKNGILEKI